MQWWGDGAIADTKDEDSDDPNSSSGSDTASDTEEEEFSDADEMPLEDYGDQTKAANGHTEKKHSM